MLLDYAMTFLRGASVARGTECVLIIYSDGSGRLAESCKLPVEMTSIASFGATDADNSLGQLVHGPTYANGVAPF